MNNQLYTLTQLCKAGAREGVVELQCAANSDPQAPKQKRKAVFNSWRRVVSSKQFELYFLAWGRWWPPPPPHTHTEFYNLVVVHATGRNLNPIV